MCTKEERILEMQMEKQDRLRRILFNSVEEALLQTNEKFTKEDFEAAMEFITIGWDMLPLEKE